MLLDIVEGSDISASLFKTQSEWERTKTTTEVQNKRMTVTQLRAELSANGKDACQKKLTMKDELVGLLTDTNMVALRQAEKDHTRKVKLLYI